MFWVKLGILLIGSLFALLLPYVVYKTVNDVRLNLRKYTLSFLSNRELYGEPKAKGYTWLLLITAFLLYLYFALLTDYYLLGAEERLLTYINYSVAGLALLACVRHNMIPYSFKTFRAAIQRLGHNLFAVVVFLSLPGLIITFQSLVIGEYLFLGVGGFIIIGLTIGVTLFSVIKQGINGITEMLFINGLSFWTIFVTLVTFLNSPSLQL